ncbi:MAG TPA: hypothetical protein PJ982_00725 [Lacipirellulaceae bacterium]|nr:hypothetical protein [Lacipirellulaceae bacterium]
MKPCRLLLACLAAALSAAGLDATPAAGDAAAHTDAPRIKAARIGLGGVYKLGSWTQLRVDVASAPPVDGPWQLTAVTTDPDGLPTTFSVPWPSADGDGASASAEMFVRVGQAGAALEVRLLDADGALQASRVLRARSDRTGDIPPALPAARRVLGLFGVSESLDDLARDQQSEGAAADALRMAPLDAADLPTRWYGYEGVDALLFGAERLDQYAALAADAPRRAALRRWIELGGRVVIFCGAAAPELIAVDGPLADLTPGRFAGEIAQLLTVDALAVFSGAEKEITLGVGRLAVPRLVDVTGRVLAAGPANLPLVARQRIGLGDVTFVAVDLQSGPIAAWSGRAGLVREALGWTSRASQAAADIRAAAGADDLVNHLRAALDAQLTGVSVTPFALVAALVLAYVALIGPGDYYLLRWLRRPELTWLTFGLTVAAVTGGAYALASHSKGDQLRVNQVEVVDVDLASREARGTVWTHLFNPRIQRFDLSFAPRVGARGVDAPRSERLAAWLGAPGPGLGGMRGQRGLASLFEHGYEFAPDLSGMTGLPVEQWSTRTLTARWSAAVDDLLPAELRAQDDDLLVGRIENRTGVRLQDCLLMHGRWAQSLPPLDDGAAVQVGDPAAPRTVRTVRAALTSVGAGDDPTVRPSDDGSVVFDPAGVDVARIVKAMMFHDAVRGTAYTRMIHRYQSWVDLSPLLRGDQAILLARAPPDAGSQWTAGAPDESAPPLAGDAPSDDVPRPIVGPAPIPTP